MNFHRATSMVISLPRWFQSTISIGISAALLTTTNAAYADLNPVPFPVTLSLLPLEGARVPILMPDTLPLKVYVQSQVTATGYRIDFYADPGCYSGYCEYGYIIAYRTGQIEDSLFDAEYSVPSVQLVDGSTARWTTPPSIYSQGWIEWQYQGVTYQASVKYADRDQLVGIANSAISAGDRAESRSAEAQCAIGLRAARSRLESGRRVTAEISDYDLSDGSDEYLAERSFEYSFSLSGPAAESVMNSPVLMRAISTDIIEQCPSTGAVTFVLSGTDWVEMFGLMNNGQVEAFQCLDPDVDRVPWGWTVCL